MACIPFTFKLVVVNNKCGRPGSSVGIATQLWAGRSGIASQWV